MKAIRWVFILAALTLPQAVQGAQWRATVGAQNNSEGMQALAFLPSEMWIRAGDSISWTFPTDEIHTVTFLKNGQVRLPFTEGCPGYGGTSFDGSTCLSTPPLLSGQTYTVTFPSPGNFKLVCLVHENMTAVVHVFPSSAALPHDQAFYDKEAARQQSALLTDKIHDHEQTVKNAVTVGNGDIVATGGGSQSVSQMRFLSDKAEIHVGETVEWTNEDPVTPHTITFGVEPANPIPPSANVTVDADGARHATINSTSDSVHSGFIVSAPQERIGLAQAPLSFTRFRVTFTHAGVYPYICALHDDLGMKGTITVKP
jgi:plastocyanin